MICYSYEQIHLYKSSIGGLAEDEVRSERRGMRQRNWKSKKSRTLRARQRTKWNRGKTWKMHGKNSSVINEIAMRTWFWFYVILCGLASPIKLPQNTLIISDNLLNARGWSKTMNAKNTPEHTYTPIPMQVIYLLDFLTLFLYWAKCAVQWNCTWVYLNTISMNISK